MKKTYFTLYAISFFLNLIWESLHWPFLYKDCNWDMNFAVLMFYVSNIDALLIVWSIILWNIFWKQRDWFYDFSRKKQIYIGIITIFIAILVEIKWVYLFHEWAYSDIMPLVFGIGLSPLLQLILTSYISIYILRKYFLNKQKLWNNHII